MKIIAPVFAEIKPEEKLVCLDMLKLYWGEGIVQQNPEDLDPDQWLDEGELTELPEVPGEGTEVGARGQSEDQGRHELHLEPDLEIPVIPENPEEMAVREGIHERIQAEIYHEDKEAKPGWKKC